MTTKNNTKATLEARIAALEEENAALLAKSERKQRPLVPCACGCGKETRAAFAPGHDARVAGWLRLAAHGLPCSEKHTPKGKPQPVSAERQAAVVALATEKARGFDSDYMQTALAGVPRPSKAKVKEARKAHGLE